MSVKIESRNCPLCDEYYNDTYKLGYVTNSFPVIKCPRCSFVYLNKSPLYEELKENIAWEKSYYKEIKSRSKSRPINHKLSTLTRWRFKIVPKSDFSSLIFEYSQAGKVLDIGCGDGTKLSNLNDKFTPYGIEISKTLSKAANLFFKQYGGSCINEPAIDGLRKIGDNSYVAITLYCYLEHESNPLKVLKECYRVLKDSGIIIIKVPNFNSINRHIMGKKWCGFRFPDHLNYFTPKSLNSMLQEAGFSKFHSKILFKIPTSDNMYLIAEK